jgi:hypothetical protein
MATTIDIDTGGTFTDAFVVRDGDVHTAKVLTTPHDLALCFAQVVEAVAEQVGEDVPTLLRSAACVRYATTVGTNAVIQRTGPRLGLLRADGQEVPDTPFLDADMIADVGPPPNGHDPVVEAGKGLLARSARALVCSLPGGPAEEERAVRTRFEAHYPRHCLDAVPLLLSHEVAADPDDARRTRIALTPEGARLFRGVRGERREALGRALAAFTDEESAELARLLTKLADNWSA